MFLQLVPFLGLMVALADSVCPNDFEEVAGSCFYFEVGAPSVRKNWNEARSFCQNKEADLPILDDCKMFTELVRFIYLHPEYDVPKTATYWLGGNDRGSEGQWNWINGEAMSRGPPFWGSFNGTAEPSHSREQNCAVMYKDDRYYFHDGECERASYIICQAKPLTSQ